MVGLFNLFVNNKNKPKKNTVSKVVANKREAARRNTHRSTARKGKGVKDIDPVGKAVTDNVKNMKKSKKKEQSSNSSSDSSSNSSSNSSDSSSSEGGSSSGGTSSSYKKKVYQKARKRALSSISKMKDSNINFYTRYQTNDLWNDATSNQLKDVWEIKEEIFLYTFHDKEKHRYIMSVNIDCDKQDIMYTCQITVPYSSKLMKYWIPGKTTFAIIGGTFDREVLFIGRVSEINQRGEEIEIVGQNIGWKFKAYMTEKFQKSLKNMTVKNAVKMIFKQLGLTKGKYYINLGGIPDLDKYTIGEDCDVERGGESVQTIPDLEDVVKNIHSYNINEYVAKDYYTREVQQVANSYDQATKMKQLDQVVDSQNSYYPSSLRRNYGVSTTYENGELIYEPYLQNIQGTQELEDFIVQGYSGTSEYTYEDVLNNIATAIDAHFFIVDTTVCFVSFNALLTMPSMFQKKTIPTIDFWQLQDGSYNLDVNQYGYYNTVIIKYKNGTLKKSYEDLVNIFDEIAITYKEPNLDYNGAMLKAQAYLSAHIRDFGMQVKATILHTGKITPCSFIRLRNPLTMSEGLFFVQGTSIQWSADNDTITCDLDLRYGPENPNAPEIPETGTSYKQSSSSSNVKENVSSKVETAAQEMIAGAISTDEKAERIYQWFVHNIKYSFYWNSKHSVSKTLEGAASNCYDTCICAYQLFTAAGVPCQFIHGTLYTSGSSYGHYWLKIKYQGKWEICDLGRGNKEGIGKYNGKLSGGRVEQKNY